VNQKSLNDLTAHKGHSLQWKKLVGKIKPQGFRDTCGDESRVGYYLINLCKQVCRHDER